MIPEVKQKDIDLAVSLLGKPYIETGPGDGPDSFHCWGLIRYVQMELWGRFIPAVNIKQYSILEFVKAGLKYRHELDWHPIDKPVHSCLVELSHGMQSHHIGVYLDVDGGGLLHALKGSGVVFDSIPALKASGWRHFVYDYPN